MTRVLHLDRTRCDGRGLCIELLSGRLQRDDWGYPVLRHGELPLSDADNAAAAEAVALCPVLALRIIDR